MEFQDIPKINNHGDMELIELLVINLDYYVRDYFNKEKLYDFTTMQTILSDLFRCDLVILS